MLFDFEMKRCKYCGIEITEVPIYHPHLKHWIYCTIEHLNAHLADVFLTSNEDYYFFPGQSVNCIMCKWEGELKDCKQEYYYSSPQSWRSLGGREGYQYFCPKCNFTVKQNWIRLS